jgi:hypothetical protein
MARIIDTRHGLRLNPGAVSAHPLHMRSAFIDKLLKRMDRLEPGEIQAVVVGLMKE